MLLNIFIAEFLETVNWAIGRKDDACGKKRKELIRHIKTITKDMEFVQSYHQRAETSIAIAMRMNSSFYIDTTRPLSSSVVFGELPLSSVLLLYKLQQSSELSL